MENKKLVEYLKSIKFTVDNSKEPIGMCCAIDRVISDKYARSDSPDWLAIQMDKSTLKMYLIDNRPTVTKVIKYNYNGGLIPFRNNKWTYWWNREDRIVRLNWLDKQIAKYGES